MYSFSLFPNAHHSDRHHTGSHLAAAATAREARGQQGVLNPSMAKQKATTSASDEHLLQQVRGDIPRGEGG